MENYHEPQDENDLFFTCSLIEHMARATQNNKRYIVNTLNFKLVEKIYNLADVYHCENMDQTTEEFVAEAGIENGNYDYSAGCKYKIPVPFEIGRVYQKLILNISRARNQDYISVLFEVYNSWIADKIDNYNSNMYYCNADYIYQCYLAGEMLAGA